MSDYFCYACFPKRGVYLCPLHIAVQEMLEALKAADSHFGESCPDRYNGGPTLATAKIIRATISKAEGRE